MTDVTPPAPAPRKIWPLLVVVLILIVGTGGFLWFIGMQNESPATVLPANYTLAYIGNAEQGGWKSLLATFPVLEAIPPLTQKGTIIAIMKNGADVGWITFTPAQNTQGLVSASPLARFHIESSSPELQTMLTKGDGALEATPAFATLAPGRSTVTSWVYMDLRYALRGAETDIDTAFRNAMGSSIYGLYTETPTGFELRLAHPHALSDNSAPLALAARNDAFFIADATPHSTWNWLMNLLSPEKKLVAEGRLGAMVKDVFGKDISVLYTVAPLFDAPSTIDIATGTGGSTALVVRGSMQNGTALDATEKMLFESLHQSLPQSSVDRHAFDQGFGASVIYQDPSAVEEDTASIGTWTVHTLRSKTAHREFAFAKNGSSFVFSTSLSALTDTLQQKNLAGTGTTLMLATGNGILLSRGMMTLQAARTLCTSFGIPFQSTLIPGLQRSAGAIHWILTKEDDILVLRASLMDK